MSQDVFPNSKPILLGSDTHAADLTGTASLAEDSAEASTQGVAGTTSASNVSDRFTAGVTGFARATFTDVVTPTNSVIILAVGQCSNLVSSGTGSKDWQWKKDSVNYLSSFTLQNAQSSGAIRAEISVIIDDNPESGTHTYTLTDVDTAQFGGVACKITFVQLTDTHTASLTGFNTQHTQESGVIP